MKRKDFLHRLLLGSGAVLIPVGLFNACKYIPKIRTELTQQDIPLLDEIGETIIPTTENIPGAKAAKIGKYMLLMVKDCFNPKDQAIFIEGLNSLDERCSVNYEKSFIDIKSQQRLELLKQIQTEAIANNSDSKHYFDLMKNLTLSGYYTSEIGATQARRYLSVPGKYEACIPYKKGDLPWAT